MTALVLSFDEEWSTIAKFCEAFAPAAVAVASAIRPPTVTIRLQCLASRLLMFGT